MEQGRLGKALDVVGQHVVAAIDRSVGPGQLEQRQRATRAGAHGHTAVRARLVDQLDDVAFQIRIDVDIFDRCAHFEQLRGRR